MSATKFIEGLKEQISAGINCAALATILRFDPLSMKADIKPDGLPVVVDVPVALQKAGPFFIRVPYQAGDRVVVAFSDMALDGSSATRHRLDDAIIVGGITTGALPAEHAEDLLIMHQSANAKIVISADGGIVIQGTSINISEGS